MSTGTPDTQIIGLRRGESYIVRDTTVTLMNNGVFQLAGPGGMNGEIEITNVKGSFAIGEDNFDANGLIQHTVYQFELI